MADSMNQLQRYNAIREALQQFATFISFENLDLMAEIAALATEPEWTPFPEETS